MKLYKLLAGLIAIAGVTALSSCSKDDNYTAAELEVGTKVFFSNELPSTVNASSLASSVDIVISRTTTDGAMSVPLTVTNPDGLFNIPTSVDFASGAAEANITITYDPSKIDFDSFSTVTIAIDPSMTSQYGIAQYTFQIGIPAPWKSLGTGKLYDGFWSGKTYNVEIQQNEITPALYRVVDPYADKSEYTNPSPYLEFWYYKAGEIFDGEVLAQDLIWYDSQTTISYYSSYDADIKLVYYNPDGNTVLGYQEDGQLGQICLKPYYYIDGVGGWYDNYFQVITFPGYTPIAQADYSAEVEYGGILTHEGDYYVQAEVLLGEDVAYANVAYVAEADAATIEQDMEAGTVTTVEITESGIVNIPIDAMLEDGNYYIIVLTYDGENESYVDEGYTGFKISNGLGAKARVKMRPVIK